MEHFEESQNILDDDLSFDFESPKRTYKRKLNEPSPKVLKFVEFPSPEVSKVEKRKRTINPKKGQPPNAPKKPKVILTQICTLIKLIK